MEEWLANPSLMRADTSVEYHTIIEIDLETIKEPVFCAPNDPNSTCLLSEVQGEHINEVFISSCMKNIGSFVLLASY